MRNQAACKLDLTEDSDLLSALSSSSSDLDLPDRQLHAFDGDLLHKQWLREFGLVPSDSRYALLVENVNQGAYLRKYHPNLFPRTPNPSDRLQGTFFEYYFFTSLVFRSKYIVRLTLGIDW